MSLKGHVAELVYAYVSEAYGVTLGGSNPLVPTCDKVKLRAVSSVGRATRLHRVGQRFKSSTAHRFTSIKRENCYLLIMERLVAIVSGRVQMVMYRDFVKRTARRLRITGQVRNLATGAVEVIAEGPSSALEELLLALKNGSLLSRVEEVQIAWDHARGDFQTFDIAFK